MINPKSAIGQRWLFDAPTYSHKWIAEIVELLCKDEDIDNKNYHGFVSHNWKMIQHITAPHYSKNKIYLWDSPAANEHWKYLPNQDRAESAS